MASRAIGLLMFVMLVFAVVPGWGRSEDGDPLSGALVIRRRERPGAGGQWAAYGACVAAVSSAAVSLYWALGGTAGLGTVGGFAEKMARSGGAVALLIISVTVLLKTLGGLLALALARPWGLRLPRRALLIAGIGASAVLIIYGAAEVAAGALAETRAITPPGPVDWTALRWHLGLWDPWFLVWGLLLAAATRGYRRQPREVAVTGEGGVR